MPKAFLHLTQNPRPFRVYPDWNSVSPAAYGDGTASWLPGEPDAKDLAATKSKGMKPRCFSKKGHPCGLVVRHARRCKTAEGGDPFFLSIQGHGGQMPDTNGDEADNKDETCASRDGQLIDDELISNSASLPPASESWCSPTAATAATVTRAIPMAPPLPGQRPG